jgi:predicted amidohydrolase YtcJ
VSGIKVLEDGSPVEYRVAMRQPYTNRPSTSGELLFSQEEVEAILLESLQNKEQIIFHAIGDRAIQTIFDAMDRTGGKKVWWNKRVRIEHGDFLFPDLLLRAKELGIILVQDPFNFRLGDMIEKFYGKARRQMAQPLRSALDAGIPLAFGSDGPNNFFALIQYASNHPSNPKEAISRYEALEAATRGSAYAEFEEYEKGSLMKGMLADFAVLSDDPLEVPDAVLADIKSVLTVVGGRIAYDAKVVTLR